MMFMRSLFRRAQKETKLHSQESVSRCLRSSAAAAGRREREQGEGGAVFAVATTAAPDTCFCPPPRPPEWRIDSVAEELRLDETIAQIATNGGSMQAHSRTAYPPAES